MSPGLLDGIGDGSSLRNDLEALAAIKERNQPLPDNLVVVHDEQAKRRLLRSGRVLLTGI
jgi:hypothetical protein